MKQCIKTNGVLFFFCLISLIITAQEQSVQSNIKCLNYPSSFELLLRHFKGKIVYIDVMASWHDASAYTPRQTMWQKKFHRMQC